MRTAQRLATAVLSSCLLLSSACSDNDKATAPPAATSTPVTVHTPTPTSTATATALPTATETAAAPTACDAEPVIMTTRAGVDFVRTPDSCFASLPDWPYAPRYVEIDGLRQAYVDEGPADGPVVLLLHGQPSWSYLYRKMIPVLAGAGFRVIAMDHLGMGRSDKPIDIESYSFLGHYDRLARFIEELGLTDINLFVHDWGSLLGLRYAGLNPDRFARIAVGDGTLPVIPAGIQPFPPVENPDEIADIPSIFAQIPAQQPPFYDGCQLLLPGGAGNFGDWMVYAMTAASFRPSEVIEAMTWFDLPEDVEAAYDAPFPSRIYMAGPRTFPSLVNDLPGLNDEAWAGLTSFTKPFLTIWASNDPGNLGRCETQQRLIDSIPGAAGLPHVRLPEASHFLQEDQGAEIARRLVQFYRAVPFGRGSRYCEVLVVHQQGARLEADVWGTQGLNDCPAESWDALDPETIRTETGAFAVFLNGPRIWLPNATTGELPSQERMTFGDLETRFLATVEVDPIQQGASYTEIVVRRSTTFTFRRGEEIYELESPAGVIYVMQALSQIVDPDLTLSDLPTLGERLMLPEGWRYHARTLESDLVLTANGEAIVIQDELGNTYQRMTAGPPPSPLPTPTSAPTLPILDDGTGTPCNSDAQCEGLGAAHCLRSGALGFCTVEGCASHGCGAPYVCCFDCNPAAAPFLPFEGSACIPSAGADQLISQAGCTCAGSEVIPTATSAPATPTPTAGTPSCLSSVGRDVPEDLAPDSPLSIADRVEIRAVNEEGCAALDGPLVAFNWFSFTDPARYLQYAAGIAEIFARRGHRVLFSGTREEVLEAPEGAPSGGGSYVHQELALALYTSAGGFLDMMLSPEFQAILSHQQGGARQEDYVWGLQRCLIGCADDAPSIGDGLYLVHIFDYLGDDLDAAIAGLDSVENAPEIVYAGDLVAELRVIVGGLAINPQKPLWGRGVVLYRIGDRESARRWISDPAFAGFRRETREDVLALIEYGGNPVNQERIGFEILEIQSPNSIRAWISSDITRAEFDALELPMGWFKNQPRTGDPDASRFLRSPDAAVEGEYLDAELFGFTWRHSATVVQPNIPLDEQGLLNGSLVRKFHEVTFNAGRTIVVLRSPEGEAFVRIGRDANRVSDDPSIPDGWRLVEYTTPEQLVILFAGENLVIRTDNQDSFQGPVPELEVAF